MMNSDCALRHAGGSFSVASRTPSPKRASGIAEWKPEATLNRLRTFAAITFQVVPERNENRVPQATGRIWQYRFVDRMAFGVCPVFCRIIFDGE
jgi:hypothetical protein